MKKSLILFCLFLFAGFGMFAETINTETINLEQVRTLALSNSRSLARHNMTLQTTLLDERARVYSNLPSLSVGASASMTLWSGTNAAPIENPFDTLSSGASVSVSYRIYDGGRTKIQKVINEIATENAKREALAEYFNVLDTVDNAYYAVLEAAAALRADEASLQTSLATLAIAEIRQSNGMITPSDFLRALAEKESRENSRNQTRRNLSLAITRLRSITGLTHVPELEEINFERYEQVIQSLAGISDEDADKLYNELWKLLAAANPSLTRAGLANQRAENNLSMARRGFVPSLSASFSTGLNISPDNGVSMSGGRLSLSASIPVDVWVIRNNVARSEIARDSVALDYINAEAALETELYTALINVFGQAGTILSSRRSLEYAEKHSEFVMERYRLSLSTMSEMADASSLLITSNNNLIRAKYGFLRSLSRIRSLGAIDSEEKLAVILSGE